MKSWLVYTVMRVALFAAVFAGLMLLGLEGWLAAVLAAIIGLCVAYIFLRGPRERAVAALAARRETGADEAAEDRD